MKKRKNLFIALEGIDGSGKSTQTKLLTEKLQSEGHKVYATFEPTNTGVGAMIREILKGNAQADERVIAGLFVADRLDHLLNETYGIVKKLEEGYTVVMDRYLFSSYAYQGTHVDQDWVIQANSMAANILRPDMNIFIDVAPEISMQRLQANRANIELYETLENLHAVRAKYIEAFEKQKFEENILIVEGNRTPDLIAHDIWQEVLKWIELEELSERG
jgi:dTMP kinase